MRVEFHTVDLADMAATHLSTKRIDGYTVEFSGANFLEAHSLAYNVFGLAAHARVMAN